MSDATIQLSAGSLPAISATTAADGSVRLEQIPPGLYRLGVRKDGFESLDAGPIEVPPGQVVERTLTLAPAMVRDSVEVHDTAPTAAKTSSDQDELRTSEVKDLPSRPATVTDALPLLPGITRSPQGEININGTGEHRSAFVVNQADVTDPATGKFGESVPIDSVLEVQVFKTPFMAQYGRFTSGVVAVETRRGGDKWHYELNDPLPDFRFRSWHMVGIRDSTPRAVIGGPLIKNRLYFAETLQYDLKKTPDRTLPYPHNESKQEAVNSFAQLDYILSPRQILTGTLHITPQHVNFVDPNFFNPQPTTPDYRQHDYVGTLIHHFAIGQGMLDSTLSFQRFDASVGAQGTADMILTPSGDVGNYFSTQGRQAGRTEWLETWSPAAIKSFGHHELKFGSALARTSDAGLFTARPIDILDPTGILLRQITFAGGSAYLRNDVEAALFAQDHWAITPKIVMDAGLRLERQNLAESFRIAPRVGIAWTPFGRANTVVRAGYGVFYDHVPLNVYTFNKYPQQIVTNYAPDGTILGSPIEYLNLTGMSAWPNTLLIHNSNEPGSFSPHSSTWNLQVEHPLTAWLKLRATYSDSHSAGLITMNPESAQGVNALVLNGGGVSSYRQMELTARFAWKPGQQLFLAYTGSRAQGDLNDFNTFLGNYPSPLIRPNTFATLPGDLPNRFLAWGRVALPWKMAILPTIEYRNGLPYAQYDVLGNYAGVPNSFRYPNFFSTDARLIKDFQVNNKYTLRFSVSGANLTNHFNALAVHSNLADPQSGVFFGNYPRRLRVDFDVVF